MFAQCPCYQARPTAQGPCILAAYVTVFASPYHVIEGLFPAPPLSAISGFPSVPWILLAPHLVFMTHNHTKSCRKSLLRKKRTRPVPLLSLCRLNYRKRQGKENILQIYNFLSRRVLKEMA